MPIGPKPPRLSSTPLARAAKPCHPLPVDWLDLGAAPEPAAAVQQHDGAVRRGRVRRAEESQQPGSLALRREGDGLAPRARGDDEGQQQREETVHRSHAVQDPLRYRALGPFTSTSKLSMFSITESTLAWKERGMNIIETPAAS